MQPAVGYVRVSTVDQATEGVSLDSQKAQIKAWAQVNGYALIDIYVDAGISGYRVDKRPGLQKAIKKACNVPCTLIVYSLSRLARNTKEVLALSEKFDASGAAFASLTEKLDTSTAAGKMTFRLLAMLAEFERDLISERTKSALQHQRNQFQRTGKIPYGFDLAQDGKTLNPNEEEMKVIFFIRELRGKGWTLNAIGEELGRRGIRTKAGSLVWYSKVIRGILADDHLSNKLPKK